MGNLPTAQQQYVVDKFLPFYCVIRSENSAAPLFFPTGVLLLLGALLFLFPAPKEPMKKKKLSMGWANHVQNLLDDKNHGRLLNWQHHPGLCVFFFPSVSAIKEHTRI